MIHRVDAGIAAGARLNCTITHCTERLATAPWKRLLGRLAM